MLGRPREAVALNGAHDVGGMHGFGPVHPEDDAAFHAVWERRVRAMMMGLLRRGAFNIDEMRRAIESIPPAEYLASSYFERWLVALRALVVEKGLLTPAEIDGAVAGSTRTAGRRDDPALAARFSAPLRGGPASPAVPSSRFRPGDVVVARNQHAIHHTRLPRYIRGKRGRIDRVHGVYTFPDTNAHGGGEHPQPVYSVRFSARDLWGDVAAPADCVYIDLWESYLDPAEAGV
jgi:nitrile hydratase